MAKAMSEKSVTLTTNELVVERDNAQLAQRYQVFELRMPDMENKDGMRWLKRSELVNAASVASVDIISTVYDSSTRTIFLMAPVGCDCSRLSVVWKEPKGENQTLYPKQSTWDAVNDYALVRLLVNACAAPKNTDGGFANATGALYRAYKQIKTKHQWVVFKIEVGELNNGGIVLNAVARTLTERKTLLKAAGNDTKEVGKIKKLPIYNISSNGYLSYLPYSEEAKSGYCFGKSKYDTGNNTAKFLVIEDKSERGLLNKKLTRAYTLHLVTETVNEKFAGCAQLVFKTYDTVDTFSENYSVLKEESLLPLVGQILTVTYYSEAQKDLASRLIDYLRSEHEKPVNSKKRIPMPELRIVDPCAEPDPLTLNIQIVPDEDAENSPVLNHNVSYPIQHITQSKLEDAFKEEKSIRATAGNLLKELAVKQDIQADHYSAFEMLSGETASISGVVNLAKSDKPKERDVRFCHLYIGEQGDVTAYSSHKEGEVARSVEEAEREQYLYKKGSDGSLKPLKDNYVISIGDGAALIRDSGAITLPNEMAAMFDEMFAGISVRNKTFGARERYLAPLYGIRLFKREGVPSYIVGQDQGFNVDVPNAVHVREVVSLGGPDITHQVAKQLESGLSRYGRATVLPVLAKYLREYASIHEVPGSAGRQALG